MVSHPITVLQDAEAYREACEQARRSGRQVGLVPTMGALHDGHTALIRQAADRAQFVVVSIFVNPTQFGPNEDFARYPRTLERDVQMCAAAGAQLVFAPSVTTMYPPGEQTRVKVGSVAEPLCGASRPGHFEGVATIVAKLLALTGRCVAVFGRKDYQQLKVIERMARDLMLGVQVVGIRTVREADGLAMSSRNRYLSEDDRKRASELPKALSRAVRAFEAGERSASVLRAMVRTPIEAVSHQIDYVELADADTLRVIASGETIGERALLALAARIGSARLIDNVVLGEDPAPCGEV